MNVERIGLIGTEPVPLSELRRFARLDYDDDDIIIDDARRAAREHIENISGWSLAAQRFKIQWAKLPTRSLYLPYPILDELERVYFLDADGQEQDIDLGDISITRSEPFARLETAFPSGSQLTIEYATVAKNDAKLIQITKMLAVHWLEARSPVVMGSPSVVPATIQGMITNRLYFRPYNFEEDK